jgi:hypothetical protein
MSPIKSIVLRARHQLQWLGGALLLTLALIGATHYFRESLRKSVSVTQAQLNAQQALLNEKEQDQSNIQTHIKEFRVLKEKGLVGTPDREGWVEQLITSRTHLKLPDTLTYTLSPPKPMDEAAATDPATPSLAGAMAHDLEFDLKDIHETELLDLLRHYRANVHGSFRVQSCALLSPSPNGLVAKCSLRFYTMPEAAQAS